MSTNKNISASNVSLRKDATIQEQGEHYIIRRGDAACSIRKTEARIFLDLPGCKRTAYEIPSLGFLDEVLIRLIEEHFKPGEKRIRSISVGEFLSVMEKYVRRARCEGVCTSDNSETYFVLVAKQLLALCVMCGEVHGFPAKEFEVTHQLSKFKRGNTPRTGIHRIILEELEYWDSRYEDEGIFKGWTAPNGVRVNNYEAGELFTFIRHFFAQAEENWCLCYTPASTEIAETRALCNLRKIAAMCYRILELYGTE